MIIKNILNTDSIQPTTIAKMLVCESSINKFLKKVCEKMKNNYTDEFKEFIEYYNNNPGQDIDPEYVTNNWEMTEKKAMVLSRVLKAEEITFIDDWAYPYFDVKPSEQTNEVIVYGPYVTGKEIIFYCPHNQLMLIFTYFPLDRVYSVTNETYEKGIKNVDDNTVREIKSYVYDNVPIEYFDKYIVEKSSKDISFLEFKKYPILTTRYSSSSDELFKIVQNYSWDFVVKNTKSEGNY